MATWDDVRRIALALPESSERVSRGLAGYPAILARLQRIPAEDLYELVTEAWLARAPAPLVKAFLKQPL